MTIKPRVLVGCPTYEGHFYCLEEWVKNVKSFDYPNFDVLLVDNSKDPEYSNRIKKLGIKCLKSEYYPKAIARLAKAREKLHDYTVKNGYDYLFSVETDIFPQKDILKKLLSDKKDIVAAPFILSPFNNPDRRRVDWVVSFSDLKRKAVTKDRVEFHLWVLESEMKKIKLKFFQVRSCTFGCTLIKTEVLKKIKTRVDPHLYRADDSYFFEDCQKEGIEVHVDTSLYGKVGHYRRMGSGFGWDVLKTTKPFEKN